LVSLDARLASLLTAQVVPADAAERIELAGVCLDYKRKYLVAARWFAEAFAASPEVAVDPRSGLRYRATRAAALAADGQGDDAGELDAPERAHWRKQAVDWLQGDLVLWRKLLESSMPETRTIIHQTLRHWKEDVDLASLRNAALVVKLPMAEQDACRRLWMEVEALLTRTADTE
jgi:hypothetical protein